MSRLLLEELKYSPETVRQVQRVLEEAPEYLEKLQGHPAQIGDGCRLLAPRCDLGFTRRVYGFYLGGILVGLAELSLGLPDQDSAYIGLFLFSEDFQGLGLGKIAVGLLCDEVNTQRRILVGISPKNLRVLPFWEDLGFGSIGLQRLPKYLGKEEQLFVLEKNIANATLSRSKKSIQPAIPMNEALEAR